MEETAKKKEKKKVRGPEDPTVRSRSKREKKGEILHPDAIRRFHIQLHPDYVRSLHPIRGIPQICHLTTETDVPPYPFPLIRQSAKTETERASSYVLPSV
mmetsp:Transcript_15729/g.31887  ORF Transcript_15729/g.31887 Transcript_15729/m.31887 type:complete len:100 (-) Transcript_15729:1310-1609(-)